MTQTFAAQIGKWCEKVPEAVEAVFKESSQEVVATMQTSRDNGGRMRVHTGFLRASLLASTASMPSINPNAKPVDGMTYTYSGEQVEAVIIGADIGDTLHFGYTAAYAAYREYGANGQAADAFVRTAAQGWQGIVTRNAAKAKAAFGL